MSVIKKIVIILLSFSLSVLIALTAVLSVTAATIMNRKYAVKALEGSQFGEIELDRIREHFISYGSAGNVEEAFFIKYFEKNISAKTVTDDMAKTVRALYANEDISGEKYFFDALHLALNEYAEEMYMDVEDTDIAHGIKQFTGDLIELYRRYVSIPYASSIAPQLKSLKSLLPIVTFALAFLSIACAAVIFFSFRKKAIPLSYIGASLGGAGLMLISFPLIVLITRQAEKFTLTDEAFRSFFIELINGFTGSLIVCGAVLLAAFIIICLGILSRLKASPSPDK
ncbi:MAG: hypothetical protein ACOX45_00680 [Acutalibacteraceae bacterium]